MTKNVRIARAVGARRERRRNLCTRYTEFDFCRLPCCMSPDYEEPRRKSIADNRASARERGREIQEKERGRERISAKSEAKVCTADSDHTQQLNNYYDSHQHRRATCSGGSASVLYVVCIGGHRSFRIVAFECPKIYSTKRNVY